MDVLDMTEQLHELKRQRWEVEDRHGIARYEVEAAAGGQRQAVADPIEHLGKSPAARLAGLDRDGKVVCAVCRDEARV
jgi:hypothetical protein